MKKDLSSSQTSSDKLRKSSLKSILSYDDENADWEEYVISIMSKDTARWIVYKHMKEGEKRDKLKKV